MIYCNHNYFLYWFPKGHGHMQVAIATYLSFAVVVSPVFVDWVPPDENEADECTDGCETRRRSLRPKDAICSHLVKS